MSGHSLLTRLGRYGGSLGTGLVVGTTMAAIASPLPAVATIDAPDALGVVAQATEAPAPDETEAAIPFGEGETLTVEVKPITPFIFVEDSPIPYGYSVDLWEAIAERMGVETEYTLYETTPDLLEAVRRKEVDLAIAGISITNEREASGLDFSYPVYQAGVQIVTLDRSRLPVLRYANYFANIYTLIAIARVLVGCLVVGSLIWLVERRHNPSFKHGPIPGIGQGVWFALATLGTFGYGDVTPTKPWSRVIAVIWMGASFFILADFITSMSSAYQANSPIRGLEDVYNRSVAAITGSTAADLLRGKPVHLVELTTYDEIFAGLADRDFVAAVIDYPTAKYEVARNRQLLITGDRLNREDYGIAVREGQAALLEEINRDILALQQAGFFNMLDERWFDAEE